ncbi:hypothetical protein CHU_0438 [Cytophaga hutchinsonii ATCC 33406]|uniref:Uncharacterized protein n=1 Tax=Cytophaga hutchinsonii (strain ATCC 33406 / DSM 1761 / CIP 103989 / NBRC 15051 / NCIMB 9469 / D465) TaxID=269798 RepID=A0A6N4SN97_CYTH3|nr:hypothetical protein CHU_0438 [Cytophaga hutchinsonii ATCC 33406]
MKAQAYFWPSKVFSKRHWCQMKKVRCYFLFSFPGFLPDQIQTCNMMNMTLKTA